MTRIPSFEGRPLPRPSDDVDEQGLGFDLATMLTRRRALGLLGLGLSAAGLSACSADVAPGVPSGGGPTPSAASGGSASGVHQIPEEMAGPFPGDGSNGPDVLRRSGVVRSDIRSSFEISEAIALGVRMTLTLTISDLARGGVPFAGVAVYVWQCDREGGYSLYTAGLRSDNYLRGVQVAGPDGSVTFTTVFPGCYTGRWPHVHFEVYPDVNAITDVDDVLVTSQVALPEAECAAVYATDGYGTSARKFADISLEDDLVFRDDLGAHQMATVTGDPVHGYTATLAVGINSRA